MSVVDFTAEDPFVAPSKELFHNPYAAFSKLRQKGNLVWSSAGEPRWMCVGYETALSLFSDQRFGVEVPREQEEPFLDLIHDVRNRDLVTGLTKFLLSQDPPAHTRVRKLANKAFTRAEVAHMGSRIEEIIDGLIDRAAPSGKMDLISEFALPLPMTIVCEVLGLPAEDHDKFRSWTGPIVRTVEPILDPSDVSAAAQAATQLFDYLKVQIAERRKNPRADLLSAFVQAEEEGETLSLDELLSNMLLLVIAGHETTVNMIGNGILNLIRNPEAMTKLRAQPDLIPMAIEEILRYDSPLQITDRYVKEDLELEGQKLKKGDRISVVIGAANRDPRQFQSPDTFNIERQPNKHLAFGNGIHFCLGAPLARFEGKLAFEKLLKRLENIELDVDEIEYKPTTAFRALKNLPIKFKAV